MDTGSSDLWVDMGSNLPSNVVSYYLASLILLLTLRQSDIYII